MSTPAREPLRLHMRRRPGLYIGGTDARGIRAMLDDVVTELLAAPATRPERVRCTLGDDGTCCVELRGGVMPAVEPEAFVADHVEYNPADPFLSLAIAFALSDPLHAEVARDGRRWLPSPRPRPPDGRRATPGRDQARPRRVTFAGANLRSERAGRRIALFLELHRDKSVESSRGAW